MIDKHLASIPRDGWQFDFVEHERGPELLVSLALATAGMGVAKSVIDLVIAMSGLDTRTTQRPLCVRGTSQHDIPLTCGCLCLRRRL